MKRFKLIRKKFSCYDSTSREVSQWFIHRWFNSPDHVPHEEEEGISGRGAEVFAINRHLEAKHTHYIQDKYFNIETNAVHVLYDSDRMSLNHTHHDVGVSVDELDKFL